MDKEVKDYLTNLAKLLNGQLRGAINLKARKENAELVYMTLRDAFEKGEELGISKTVQEFQLVQLKEELKEKHEDGNV